MKSGVCPREGQASNQRSCYEVEEQQGSYGWRRYEGPVVDHAMWSSDGLKTSHPIYPKYKKTLTQAGSCVVLSAQYPHPHSSSGESGRSLCSEGSESRRSMIEIEIIVDIPDERLRDDSISLYALSNERSRD
jgi:hypothetical protein